jgi:hypothetical protein
MMTLSTPWNHIAADSLACLTRMFPKLVNQPAGQVKGVNVYLDPTYPFTYNNPQDPTWNTAYFVDWNGDKKHTLPGCILEGDQCLVFFLGGLPAPSTATVQLANTPPACLGFAADPHNPANPNSTDRIGPFYEFRSDRLVTLPRPAAALNPLPSTLFYSYLDPYGQSDGLGQLVAGMPYAYFSSNKGTNAYNSYGISECPTLGHMNNVAIGQPNGPGLWPYAEVSLVGSSLLQAPRYLNKNSFQLLSAGMDQVFGSGSSPAQLNPQNGAIVSFHVVWTSATASSVYPPGNYGNDDQSNFSSGILGASGN